MKKNRRIQSFALLILAAVLLAVIAVLGSFWQEAASGRILREKIWHRVYNILLERTGWDVTCSCGQLRDFL